MGRLPLSSVKLYSRARSPVCKILETRLVFQKAKTLVPHLPVILMTSLSAANATMAFPENWVVSQVSPSNIFPSGLDLLGITLSWKNVHWENLETLCISPDLHVLRFDGPGPEGDHGHPGLPELVAAVGRHPVTACLPDTIGSIQGILEAAHRGDIHYQTLETLGSGSRRVSKPG